MRGLWPWLRLLVGIGILAVLVWRLGTDAFVDGLRVIDVWSVLAALGIGLLTTVSSAWRWSLVAGRLGLRLPLITAVADYYRALLLNAVLPAGVLGDVHRAVRHGQQSGDIGRGVRAVVIERFAGQVILVVVAVAVLFTRPALVAAVLPGRGVVTIALCVLAVILACAWKWRGTVGKALADVRFGLFPGVLALSAAGLAGHLALFVVAARVSGSQATVAQLLPLLVLALLVMGLPINIGGWGPREAVMAISFGAAGLGAAQGLTAAVVYGVLTLIASLPGVLVLFLRRGDRAAATAERLSETTSCRTDTSHPTGSHTGSSGHSRSPHLALESS